MTEVHMVDFLKMNINDVSDLLLSKISGDKESASAVLRGVDQEGRKYNLIVKLELIIDE